MTARPSLVCLATSAAAGGAETSLLTLLGGLRVLEPAWEMTVIAPSGGPLLERCRSLGIAGIELPYPGAVAALGESGATGTRRRSSNQLSLAADIMRAVFVLPGYVGALRRALADRRATVVHSNGLKAHVCAALAKPAGTRLVWHLHEYVQPRPLTASLLRRLVHRADAIVVNSDSVLRDARAAFRGRGHPRRVYNAVDLTAFTPEGPGLDLAALARLPADAELVRVGLVATFGRWKGHDLFIDAIAQLPRRDRLRAYIVGGPVYETTGSQWTLAELQQRIEARGLTGVVGFTGHVSDVPAALRSLDVVVHASTQPEPFGMVIAEGMATGRAVVAVRDGGAAELFEDRVDAVGFAAGDAAGLAAAIEELLVDPERRASLGAAARAAACERFSPARMAAEFRKAYLG